MQIELSGAVQFADKNFVHRTISTTKHISVNTCAQAPTSGRIDHKLINIWKGQFEVFFTLLYTSSTCLLLSLLAWSSHLNWHLSIRWSNGSMLRNFWISELRTLFNSATPLILCKQLISDACTCDCTFLIITQDSWLGLYVKMGTKTVLKIGSFSFFELCITKCFSTFCCAVVG